MALTAADIAAERRRGRLAAAAAVAAAVLFPIGLFWSQLTNNDRPDENAPAQLRFFQQHSFDLLASAVVRTIAFALLMLVTIHLYRATKARKPDLSPVVGFVGVFGPIAAALGGLTHDVYLGFAASDFTGREFQTLEGAEDLTKNAFVYITVGFSIAGTAALAFWFVIGSLNAMRVGLLTRFTGVLGIIIGPAFLLGFAPLLLTFWLIAIGLLFIGRWPRGVPPAWAAGEAIPWPSRPPGGEQPPEEEVGGARNGEVEPVGPGVRRGEESEPPGTPPRKRKRRT